MLIGTVFGLIIIPGLYYLFGVISDKLRMAEHEDENPLTEEIDNNEPIL
jgi:HAE1 family hydrophobic/amphiphilic exporter-1